MTEKKQSISAIREIFAAASETELPPFIWNMKRIPVPAYKI